MGARVDLDTPLERTPETINAIRMAAAPNQTIAAGFDALGGGEATPMRMAQAGAPGDTAAADIAEMRLDYQRAITEGNYYADRSRKAERIEKGAGAADLNRADKAYGRAQQLQQGIIQARQSMRESGQQASLAEQKDQMALLKGFAEKGIEANGKIGQLQNIKELGDRVGYGVVPKLQSFLGEHGVETAGLSDIQAYERAINFMAPQLRPIGSGRLLQNELNAFKSALGGLMTTPEGRRASINNLTLLNDYAAHVGDIASDTMKSPSQRMKEIYAVKPPKLHIEVTKSSGAGQAQSGETTWTGPTGRTYRVKDGQIIGPVTAPGGPVLAPNQM
jgi:hypothetical protein